MFIYLVNLCIARSYISSYLSFGAYSFTSSIYKKNVLRNSLFRIQFYGACQLKLSVLRRKSVERVWLTEIFLFEWRLLCSFMIMSAVRVFSIVCHLFIEYLMHFTITLFVTSVSMMYCGDYSRNLSDDRFTPYLDLCFFTWFSSLTTSFIIN